MSTEQSSAVPGASEAKPETNEEPMGCFKNMRLRTWSGLVWCFQHIRWMFSWLLSRCLERCTSQFSYSDSLSSKSPKVFPVIVAKNTAVPNEILEKIKVEVCTDPTECDMVMVFFPVTSRLKSDMHYAMAQIPDEVNSNPIIMVVMHYTKDAKSQTAERVDYGYQSINFKVQVLYHKSNKNTEELLVCETNDQAIQRLKEGCKNIVKPMKK